MYDTFHVPRHMDSLSEPCPPDLANPITWGQEPSSSKVLSAGHPLTGLLLLCLNQRAHLSGNTVLQAAQGSVLGCTFVSQQKIFQRVPAGEDSAQGVSIQQAW